MSLFNLITCIGDKVGSLGAILSAMGCAMCFPAIASLGGALGLAFLGQWEWDLIELYLPAFASIALVINALGYISHKQIIRCFLGMTGPILLLLSLYPWFQYACSAYVTYSALGLMVTVSIADFIYPANHCCDEESCSV